GRFNPELPLERARTIPASWYTDAQLAEEERRCIFGRSWLLAGRADQVARPGFFTFDVAGAPILVVRSNEGGLRAFYTVCRHRGARVACEEQGTATGFRCRYHGWGYNSAGQLKSTPAFEGVAEFRREESGLVALSVGVWGPLVFICQGLPPM